MTSTKLFTPFLVAFMLLLALFALISPAAAATLIVTNASDDDDGECAVDCSLREAIDVAANGDIITFNDDYTIVLNSELNIDKILTIDGSNRNIIVDGNDTVRVFNVGASGVLTMSHLTVSNGFSGNADGGGIYNDGTLVIESSTISDNTLLQDAMNVTRRGGGIYNNGLATMMNSTVTGNSVTASSVLDVAMLAAYGGGIYNNGTFTISNSTFNNNETSATAIGFSAQGFSRGGAIYNASGQSLTINNSTLSRSTVSGNVREGNTIFNAGTMHLQNSIIANGTGNQSCSGNPTTNINNLIEDGSCNAAVSGDPRLSGLGDYGGDTETLALLPGSPAIDTGNSGSCEATDQRGESRFGTCDIGAFESQGFTLAVSDGDNQTANPDASFANPLEVTVTANDITEPVGSGGRISFSAPSSGASLTSDSFTASTDGSGAASATVTANSIEGSYTVTATAAGASNSVAFTLTNLDCNNRVVTNSNNSGSGSLRQAIADACDGANITFDDDYTIVLSSELEINKTLTIDGSGQTVAVSGDDSTRVFEIQNSGVVTLSHLSVISGSTIFGGGIYNANRLIVDGVTFNGNNAGGDGGAIYNSDQLTVNNSTFANNVSGSNGGGIFNIGTLTANNVTLAYNRADDGGGIYNENSGTFTLNNVLAAYSITGGDCFNEAGGNNGLTRRRTLMEDGSCNATFSGDPLLGSLGDYGGDTNTYPLFSGSQAIDNGHQDTCSGSSINSLDQRGESRPTACDIGAFESQGYDLTVSGGNNQSAEVNTSFIEMLTVTLTANESYLSVGPDNEITFSAPDSGASLATTPLTATTNGGGVASLAVMANGIDGSYNVTATAEGVETPAIFSLSNYVCSDLVVANDNDSGAGSLRQAIADACPGVTITFDDHYTITLSSDLIINKDLAIDGVGQQVHVNGNGVHQVFEIAASTEVTLSHLSIINGLDMFGGGIGNQGNLWVDSVTFDGNRASVGAGIYNSGSGVVTVTNSTFNDNNSNAVYNSGTAVINNSTFANNAATNDGTIYNESTGTMVLNNVIVAYTSAGNDCANDAPGANFTVNSSLMEDGSCGATYSGDPLLAALGDYGGETQTFALLPGSSTIDAGNDGSCEANDQRGESRVGTCDIGSFESQGFSLSVSGGNNQTATINASFINPLEITFNALDSNLNVGAGYVVTFTAPSSGASLATTPITMTTNSSSIATTAVSANDLAGNYVVTATAAGVNSPVNFTLTNICGETVVTNDKDSGAGSLREIISGACDGETITFDDAYTITLSSTLFIDKALTIDGADQAVTIDGNDTVQIFWIEATGVVTMSHLTIANGRATADGGGIFNLGVLSIQNSTILDNYSSDDTLALGGGIFNSGTLTVTNSTFSGNTVQGGAAAQGGAIANDSSSFLSVNNSTFSGNAAISPASSGSGIWNAGSVELSNTIIANSASGSDCFGMVTLRNTLIEDGTCSPTFSGDPLLSDLGDYGGDTQTFALLNGSPAIDAGDNATCASSDQRGVARPQGAICDIGSYEVEYNTLTVTLDGAGGRVTSDPASIDCGATCTAEFMDETVITLTAVPNEDYVFTGWSGGGCTGTDSCVVNLTMDVEVTAVFALDESFIYLPSIIKP